MDLAGVYIPLITPFAADGSVALDALATLAADVLDAGASGLVALGTTGEPATLDADERRSVIDLCAGICRDRSAHLIVGTGSSDTAASVRALREVPPEAAALVAVPSYTRPGEAGVLAHFERLAEDSPVPLVVYNIPYRTGQTVGEPTLRRIGSLPNVIGLKQSVGGIDAETIALLDDPPFAVLAGEDTFLSPLLAIGAAGGILASAHLRTREFVELARAWRDGDVARARALGPGLAALSSVLFAEPNPSVIKGVLHAQGRIPTPAVRLPLLPASAESTRAALLLS